MLEESASKVFWKASLLNQLAASHVEPLFPNISSQRVKVLKALYDLAKVKVDSFETGLSMLHHRLDEVSSFLDELKQSSYLAALASHITELDKLLKRRTRMFIICNLSLKLYPL